MELFHIDISLLRIFEIYDYYIKRNIKRRDLKCLCSLDEEVSVFKVILLIVDNLILKLPIKPELRKFRRVVNLSSSQFPTLLFCPNINLM